MADNLDFFPVKPSGTERNNFAKQNGHLRLPRALKSSSMPPGFFYLRKQTTSGLLQRVATGDVLYAQAGFGQTGSKPVKKSVSTCGGGAEASRRKLQPVPGVRIVECGAKEESEKETKRRERGRERRERLPPSSSALPHPVVVCFFFLLTSLCAVPTILTPGTGYGIVARKGCLVFIVFLSITTSFQNISITLLQISLKPHNIRIRRHSNIKT